MRSLTLWRAVESARLRLAAEDAARLLRKQRRLADTARLEAEAEDFMGAVFRAQGEALAGEIRRADALIDFTDRRSGATLDALWEKASDDVKPAFAKGAKALLGAGYMVGVQRFAAETFPPPKVREATPVAFKAPPKIRDVVIAGLDGRRGWEGTSFGLTNQKATDWLSQHGARLVANVDAHTRDRLRNIVTGGRSLGWSSEKIATSITEYFPQMAEGRPQEHIDSRAHGIAVTETAFAYEAGMRDVAQHVASQGVPMQKAWLTVGDDRVDEDCEENEAADWIGVDDNFPSGDSEPPAHPYCRCTTEYRVDPDWLEQPDAADAEPEAAPREEYQPLIDQSLSPYNNNEAPLLADALDDWAAQTLQNAGVPLSDETTTAFSDYTRSGYLRMNGYLRGEAALDDVGRETLEQIRLMDEAFGTTKEAVLGYRGLTGNVLADMLDLPGRQLMSINERAKALKSLISKGLKKGKAVRWHDDGFSSVSAHQDVSKGFGEVLLKVRIPGGSPVRYMNRDIAGGNWPELELLMGRGATFVARDATVVREGVAERLVIEVDVIFERAALPAA